MSTKAKKATKKKDKAESATQGAPQEIHVGGGMRVTMPKGKKGRAAAATEEAPATSWEADAEPLVPETPPSPDKIKKARTSSPPKEKKTSALDAAARVLEEASTPMTTQEMIKVMEEKGYWTSPGGLTPWATLYSAILREISMKGEATRFVKTERGRFGRKV